MLFIIAMDVLHRLFLKAARDGVLRKMDPASVKYQCSFYADDVMLFIRPTVQEARAVKEILRIFGEASGLKTNLTKMLNYANLRWGGHHTGTDRHPRMPGPAVPDPVSGLTPKHQEDSQGSSAIHG